MTKPGRSSAATRFWAIAATTLRPALRAMLAWRSSRGKEIGTRLAERRGEGGGIRPEGILLWLHAASVGEALSALPVIQALPATVSVLFTTGTVTSARLLAERLPSLGLDYRVKHRFVPLDVPAWAARFLDHWRPDAACFLESELWPNLIAGCRLRHIPLALINARLSKKSADGWRRFPGLIADMLGSFTFISARSPEDAQRLTELGAAGVEIAGDLKLASEDLPVDASELARLAALLGDGPRLLAASTHPGEDTLIAGLHETLLPEFPALITAIVPRHPSRGVALAAELGAPGTAIARRSLGCDPQPGQIWLADTLGELGLLYRLFPVVVMGKSFGGNSGGQNPLEPARLGCQIGIGPAHANFTDAVRMLEQNGRLVVLADEAHLVLWARRMLAEPRHAPLQPWRPMPLSDAAQDLPGKLATRLVGLMQS